MSIYFASLHNIYERLLQFCTFPRTYLSQTFHGLPMFLYISKQYYVLWSVNSKCYLRDNVFIKPVISSIVKFWETLFGTNFLVINPSLQYFLKTNFYNILCKLRHKNFIEQKNHKFLDKSIYFWLPFQSYCFHGHAKNDNKCSYILFLIKYKIRNIIMKTEQTTIVYAQWDRWTSYDMMKHHMITTDTLI